MVQGISHTTLISLGLELPLIMALNHGACMRKDPRNTLIALWVVLMQDLIRAYLWTVLGVIFLNNSCKCFFCINTCTIHQFSQQPLIGSLHYWLLFLRSTSTRALHNSQPMIDLHWPQWGHCLGLVTSYARGSVKPHFNIKIFNSIYIKLFDWHVKMCDVGLQVWSFVTGSPSSQ